MKGFKSLLFQSVGVWALFAVAPTDALAQSASASSPTDGLSDIVVTARKRSENIQDTPVAVSAVTGETIERTRLVRIDDLQKTVPSLVVFANPGLLGTPTFALRGISSSDYLPANENPVAIYVDGVYIARPIGALFNLGDLDRVEVLRGPQGTLNGRNATAGSISLFTKTPSDTFDASEKLSYGTYDDFTSRTTVDTGLLGSSGISARFTYVHHQVNGYIRNFATSASNSPGAINDNGAFAAVRGKWGDLTIDYKFDYDRQTGQGGDIQVAAIAPSVTGNNFLSYLRTYNPGFQLQPNFQRTVSFTPNDRAENRTTGHSLNAKVEINPAIEIKSITGYRTLTNKYGSLVGTYSLVGNASLTGAAPYTIQPITISNIPHVNINQHQFTQEFQLTGKVDRLSYVAGLYYFREKANQDYGTTGAVRLAVLAANPTAASYGAASFLAFSNVAKSKAAYGQASYTPAILDDKLELTGGLRYTKDDKHLIQTQPAPGTPTVPIPRDVARSFSNVSGEGSVKYRWTDRIMTYFRVAQAYKAGGISPRDTTFAANGYEPEKDISYEIGIKSELLDRHLRFNADVYHTKFKNLQIVQNFSAAQGCPTTTCSTTVNAGKATYDGAEAEVTIIPVQRFELGGSLGYIHPKYKELRLNTNATSDIADQAGTVFSYLSKWTLAASAQYTFGATPLGELSARVGWNYHSKRYFNNQVLATNLTEAVRDPGFHNVSAQLNLTKIKLGSATGSISVYGDNLLGKHQVLQGIDASTYGYIAYGPGRTVGLSFTGQL